MTIKFKGNDKINDKNKDSGTGRICRVNVKTLYTKLYGICWLKAFACEKPLEFSEQ